MYCNIILGQKDFLIQIDVFPKHRFQIYYAFYNFTKPYNIIEYDKIFLIDRYREYETEIIMNKEVFHNIDTKNISFHFLEKWHNVFL